jgi:hypothetical protein
MQWPLAVDPSVFIEKNTQQARTVVGHMRALSQGRLPFGKSACENSTGVKPNMNSPDEDTRAFAASIGSDFINLGINNLFANLS